jgi:hypothetical protein
VESSRIDRFYKPFRPLSEMHHSPARWPTIGNRENGFTYKRVGCTSGTRFHRDRLAGLVQNSRQVRVADVSHYVEQ